MSDQHTKITSESWMSRMGGSFKGILFGLGLIVASFVTLWWNEGRAVQTAKSLDEGQGMVVSVPSDQPNAANEGKLIHTTGLATTTETLRDEELGIESPATINLVRKVEMYQWVENQKSETKKKLGGSEETITTYTYQKEWSDDLKNSDNFDDKNGHTNPSSMPYSEKDLTAQKVTIGGFELSSNLINSIGNSTQLAYTHEMFNSLNSDLKSRAVVQDGGLFVSMYEPNPMSPRVGDVRIKYEITKPATVSIVAKQAGSQLTAYQAEAGDDLEMLTMGSVNADAMFKSAIEGNTTMTWILRFVGFIMMFFGIKALFGPIVTMGDVVPLVGNIMSYGIGFFSGVIAGVLSFVTIAIAWFWYRPVLSICLLAIGLAIFFVPKFLAKRKLQQKQQQPEPVNV